MKRVSAVLLILIIVGCGDKTQTSNDDFITVNVTKNYPKKKLILQDFMDVEYIALETTDEFITQGEVLDTGKENIVVINRLRDGNIFSLTETVRV
jgi:hypothetical protein